MKNIKSRERVKKYGEVYTPDWMVKKMCDMLENEKQQKMIIKILDKPKLFCYHFRITKEKEVSRWYRRH